VEKMTAFAGGLSKARKATVKARQGKVASREKIAAYKQEKDATLHTTTHPGVSALDLCPHDADLAVTGGVDGSVLVYNFKTGKVVDTLKQHKKRVTEVQFHPTEPLIVSCGTDNVVNVWSKADKGKYQHVHGFTEHKAEVTGCSMHPSGDYAVTSSADRSWGFFDLKEGKCVAQVLDAKVEAGFSCVSFHPDGLILGVGSSDSLLRVYDVKVQKNVASFPGHAGTVTSLCFSENGYHLASSDDTGVVKLWDLRKLNNFHTINAVQEGVAVNKLSFDLSGSYLAVAGDAVRVYGTKDWDVVKEWREHKDAVTAAKFGPDAAFIASVSMDRHIKLYH